MIQRLTWVAMGLSGLIWVCCGCTNDLHGNNLSQMKTADLTIDGQVFHVWLARTGEELSNGLMFVTADQMAPLEDGTQRGMLFVFGDEAERSFWMHNTLIPLDIAFARTDGTIIRIHTMEPLSDQNYYSDGPARFALEVNAGVFAQLGIAEGDRMEIPSSVWTE